MTNAMTSAGNSKWQRIAGWFLFVSYAVGSPIFAIVEWRTGMFSERFDFPPEFLLLVSGTQFVCALVLFKRALAPWSLAVLTVLSIGAVYSHFRIGSPLTSLPALGYTALQAWYWVQVCRRAPSNGGRPHA